MGSPGQRTTDFNKDKQLVVRGALKASQETWVFRVRRGNQIKILRDKGAPDSPALLT